MKKVYVSHSYGRREGLSQIDCLLNVISSIMVARELILKGYNPFCPNLWHYLHSGWESSPNEDIWLELVSAWISNCDCVLVAKESCRADSGVQKEIKLARSLGIPIFYNIEDIK